VFERFSDEARDAIVFAQDEARELGHGHLGTEHLLLGLLRVETGHAAAILHELGVELQATRERVGRMADPADVPAVGQMPFTPHAKRVLERSLRMSLALNHGDIGTDHILLALADEKDGIAAAILRDRGAKADTVFDAVNRVRADAPPARPAVDELRSTLTRAKELAIEAQFFEIAAALREIERMLRRHDPQGGRH
jgi:ATP-dependent Clp protease ATP-binding subunit ClpC